MDWNSSFTYTGFEPFVLFPEGDYAFTVKEINKQQHPGSEKIPPCLKVILTLEVTDGAQYSTIHHNLFITENRASYIGNFLCGVGLIKKGDTISVSLIDKAIGRSGRCRLNINTYTGKDGQEKKNNQVVRFYDQEAVPTTATPPAAFTAPAQPQPQQQQWTGFSFGGR